MLQKLGVGLRYLLAAFFMLAGLNHFLNTPFYLKIMAPYLPWPLVLVYLSGVFEIAGGILLLIPRLIRIGVRGLIALLIAVFPANIHMAFNHELFPEYHPVALWLRLPLQLVLIGLVLLVHGSLSAPAPRLTTWGVVGLRRRSRASR
jgi:uncharacterized membrane protein